MNKIEAQLYPIICKYCHCKTGFYSYILEIGTCAVCFRNNGKVEKLVIPNVIPSKVFSRSGMLLKNEIPIIMVSCS